MKMQEIITVAVIALVVIFGFNYFMGDKQPAAGTATPGVSGANADQCFVIPTYSYSAVDKYLATAVGGTDQIKDNGNAPVTSLQYPTKGDALQYWKSNASYNCEVKSATVGCGSNNVQTKCIKNATSVSLKVFNKKTNDYVNSSVDSQTNDLTLGASSTASLRVDYEGTSKTSLMPFGGCMAVEYPATISSITVNGAGISSGTPCPYAYTYSVASTSNTFRLLAVPAGFDDESISSVKEIALTLQSGSTNPSGTLKLTFQSAGYYITNDGNFALGIEKDKNDDTTKVGNVVSASIIVI